MSGPEVNPCPSCGSQRVLDGSRGMNVASKRVQCLECGMRAPTLATWNRRSTPPQTELAQALSDLLEEYEDRKSQFGDEYFWKKHEVPAIPERAAAVLAAWRASQNKEAQQ